MTIEGNKVPKVSNLVKVRNEEFGLLLVSKKTPILALNEDSKLIWECIDGIRTVDEISEYLNTEFDFDFTETSKIVKCFIEGCYELRLLEFE